MRDNSYTAPSARPESDDDGVAYVWLFFAVTLVAGIMIGAVGVVALQRTLGS